MKSRLSLAAILHDPEDRQYQVTLPYLQQLSEYYGQIFISSSPSVNPKFLQQLQRQGITTQQNDVPLGESRRTCLRMALEGGGEKIHYCDFDRIIHWIRNYPQEIADIESSLEEVDFLITGRSNRAFFTHPAVQQVLEEITNTGFSQYYGQPVDVCAGSCALNRHTAEYIVQHSTAVDNATDVEWPVLACETGFKVREKQFEGLEFETADYYQGEITASGGLEQWMEQAYQRVPQWERRAVLAKNSLQYLPSDVEYPSYEMSDSARQAYLDAKKEEARGTLRTEDDLKKFFSELGK